MSEDQEKTEDPTPERLRKAREDGNIARSKDAGAVAASGAALFAVSALGPDAFVDYLNYFENSFRSLERLDGGVLGQMFRQTLGMIAMTTIPLAGAAALGGVLIGMAEVGLQMNWSLLEPKWSRLNPLGKLQKLFSPKSAGVTTVFTLARVAVIGWIATDIIESEIPTLQRLPRVPIDAALHSILAIVGRIAFWCTLALAVLSAADYGQSWWRRLQDLKMSRQEIKDEMQQQEGNPKVKGRRMQRAREIARSGLLKEIKRADVVVANPTHVAVVLRYRPEEGAPVVSAKGLEEVALLIKEMAKEHGVPVVESKALARALYAQVKVGRQIPMDLFQAVAELLAYVYRLKRKKLTA
jgi:flagellar biosynthesis protein FlhB